MSTKKFLDDRAIENANDDKFGHLNIASQISEIISEQTPDSPINIGLFGKWGVGKSSVVELLEKEILRKEIETGSLKFIRVNVWKYQSPSSIRNKIFYEIAMQLDVEENVKKIYENSTTTTNNLNYKSFLGRFLNKKFYVDQQETIVTSVVLFLIGIFILYFLYNQNPKIGFLANILASFVGSVGVLKLGLDYFFKTIVSSTTTQSKPFESEEQFEHEIINLFNKNEFKSVKKILFIDDLDRCSSDKVLNTLETIKTFLQINNCIFIVACDHDLIKKAVVDSNKEFNYKDKDGANYLEKFFQHFIYLPPYLPANLRDYTKKLILEAQLSIGKDLGNKLDTIIYILAYRDIINPRKIKVLLNSFIFEYYSIKEKESDEKHLLQEGLITGRPERIAILTVLKVDFPLFINDLIEDPTLSSKIAYGSSQLDSKKLYDRYFGEESNLDKEYLDLLRTYLFLVKDWIPRDFTPYLYVSVESACFHKFNTLDSNRLLGLIRNGDKKILKEISEMAEEERTGIFGAIGNLQESLSNSIERRNATVVLTHMITEFPESMTVVSSSNILYSFKLNLEALFENRDDYEKLNLHGLKYLIHACYQKDLVDQGVGLTRLVEKQQQSNSEFLFFLLGFLDKTHLKEISLPTLILDLKNNIHAELAKVVDAEIYRSVVPDIMGVIQDNESFELYLEPLTPLISENSIADFKKFILEGELDAYDPAFEVAYIGNLQRLGLGQEISRFLSYIYKKEKDLYAIIVNKGENHIKNNPAVINSLLNNERDNEPWASDILFLMTMIRISKYILFINQENNVDFNTSILFSIPNYLWFLYNDENTELLEEELINLYSSIMDSEQLHNDKKISFVLKVLDLYGNNSGISRHLNYILEQGMKLGSPPSIKLSVTKSFVSSITSKSDISKIEDFVSKYDPLILLDKDHIDNEIVKTIFNLHTDQNIPKLTGFLLESVAKFKKPVDLGYVVDAIVQEKNATNIDLCLSLLLLDLGFSKSTVNNIKNELPKIYLKSFVKVTDKKSYYSYPAPIRAKILEVLLMHTDYNYNDNISRFMDNGSYGLINGFTTQKGLVLLMERLCKENDPKITSFKQQLIITTRLCQISGRTNGQPLNSLLEYAIAMLSVVSDTNSSQKKSQVNKIFQEIQNGIKRFPHEVSATSKKSFQLLARIALLVNPNSSGRIAKLAKTLGITLK